MSIVIPSIIPEQFSDIEKEVARVKNFVDCVQVDITDGIFVHDKTWPYHGDTGELAKLISEEIALPYYEDIDYEFHLMIEHPEVSVQDWISAGASSIVVHAEAVADMPAIIAMCKAVEVQITVALKASTDISVLDPYIDKIDCIQCMGSDELGHHGAALDERIYDKIRVLRQKYPEMPIAVDIGVTHESAPSLVEAGATKLIIGSAIFDSANVAESIRYFQGLQPL